MTQLIQKVQDVYENSQSAVNEKHKNNFHLVK